MHLHVRHANRFTYDAPVTEAYSELRLRPLDRSGQRCLSFQLRLDPHEAVSEAVDSFGNVVHHFDILASHEHLEVVAESEVLTAEASVERLAGLDPLDAWTFSQPTVYAPFAADLIALGRANRREDGDVRATAQALTHDVFERLRYEKGATTVRTTAAESLALGAGVCQDFTHVYLAAARSQGIAARYVSGYLYSPGDAWGGGGDDEAVASHAWVDVFVPGEGWLSLDPTHDAPQDARYIRLAVGRDYADVPPTRGVFKGRASETLSVEVRLTRAGPA